MSGLITIESITLENFLSHSKTEIKFQGQTTVIVGQNGAGKTSILDGILFALFREASRDVHVNDLIKKGTRQARVVLNLRNGQDVITITRTISPGSSIADYLAVNKIPKVRSAKEVANYVKQLLGLDKKALLSTVFIAQGGVESVIDDLEDVFKKLIKIERIEELRSSDGPIKALMDKLQDRINEAEIAKKMVDAISNDVNRLKERLKSLTSEVEAAKGELRELESELEVLEEKYNELKQVREEYLKLNSELEATVRTIADYEKYVQENEKYVIEIPDVQEIDRRVRDLEERLKKKELYDKTLREYNEYTKVVEELEKEIRELTSKLKEKSSLRQQYEEYINLSALKKKIEKDKNKYIELLTKYKEKSEEKKELEGELQGLPKVNPQAIGEKYKEVEDEVSQIEKRLGEVDALIKNRIEDVDKIRSASGKCPLCGSPLTEEHRLELLKGFTDEIERLKGERNDLEARLKSLRDELNRLKEEQKEAIKVAERIAQTRQKLDKLNREIAALKEQLAQLEPLAKKYDEVSQRLNELEPGYQKYLSLSSADENKLNQLMKRKEDYLGKIKEIEAELEGLKPYANEDLQKLKDELQELYKERDKALKLLELKNKINTIKEKIRELEQKKNELEERIKGLNFNEKEFKEIEDRLENIKKRTSTLRGIIGAKESEITSMKDEIARKEGELRKYEEKAKAQEKYAVAYEKLKKLREALSEARLQAFLMVSAKQLLEKYLNEIANYFDLKYTALEIVQEKGLEIYGYLPNGQKIPIKAMSGGERVSISLSLRLALARLMRSNVGFIIMDEPTVHLDDYRRKELLEVVRKANEIVPQIILVTHDEELKDVGDEIIKVEMEGDSSKVKVETSD